MKQPKWYVKITNEDGIVIAEAIRHTSRTATTALFDVMAEMGVGPHDVFEILVQPALPEYLIAKMMRGKA